MWQQLELVSGLESDLRDTVVFQLISQDESNDTGSIDMKMDGSVLEEKSSFKILVLTFSSKLDWGS